MRIIYQGNVAAFAAPRLGLYAVSPVPGERSFEEVVVDTKAASPLSRLLALA